MLRLKPFELERPTTVDDAVSALAGAADAMPCAGGTDLVPKLKRGQFDPRVVVSLEGIAGLDFVEEANGRLEIGALTSLSTLERSPEVARLRALVEAVSSVATPIIRERATIGGNLLQDTRCRYYDRGDFWRQAIGYCLKKDGDECRVAPGGGRCFASLCSDPAAALITLDAEVTLLGESERTIPLASLYLGDGMNPFDVNGEILTRVSVPLDGRESRYRKLRLRGSFDFPEAGVAVSVQRRGEVAHACVAVTAIAPDIFVLEDDVTPDGIDGLADAVFRGVKPVDTLGTPPAYRKAVVRSFVRQILDELLSPR